MNITARCNKNKRSFVVAAVFLGLAAVLGLQGCSSGGSSAPPPPPPEDASGLFKGTGSVNSGTTLTDVRGFVHAGRFIFFDETESVLYDGQITNITSSDLTATVDVYKDGIKVTTSRVSVTGTVTGQSSMSLTLSGTGYAAGTLSLTFDPLYNRGATIAKLVARAPFEWIGAATTASAATLIDSTDNADFTGSAAGGVFCNYTGTKNIPDADINIYQLTLIVDEASNCDHIGMGYTGFFAVVDGAEADDTVLFAATNGTKANFSIMIRNIL